MASKSGSNCRVAGVHRQWPLCVVAAGESDPDELGEDLAFVLGEHGFPLHRLTVANLAAMLIGGPGRRTTPHGIRR